MSKSLEERYKTSHLSGGNAAWIEMQYERYLQDPQSVVAEWREYFARMGAPSGEVAHGPIRDELVARAHQPRARAAAGGASPEALERQAGVMRLIHAYRLHGHQLAHLDPLGLAPRGGVPDLDPAYHDLSPADMDTEFFAEHLAATRRLKLRDILDLLRTIYSRRIGAEFAHITATPERLWLRERLEVGTVQVGLGPEEKRQVLRQLTAAEGIERYLHTRYVGQKRFSLEGGESLIPLLGDLVQHAGAQGVQEVVIGMAHRGRINVLVNVLGKSPAELFSEFEGLYDPKIIRGSGDVKYHLGFSADVRTPGGNVHVALAFNPSHLEIVNPVVEGSVRARQVRRGDTTGAKVLPVLIHGDAAFAGQGVVMETMQLSQARGFYTGGTVHVICNNQIGFTTSNPVDARSTPYCSDVAKLLEAPVLHVNADDPEAVVFVTRLALEYRKTFRKDVVVDLVCYRRHGHNEADEPAATQPVMYKTIRARPPVRRLYSEQLQEEGVTTDREVRTMVDDYRQGLDQGHLVFQPSLGVVGREFAADWSPFKSGEWTDEAVTALPRERIDSLSQALTRLPAGFKVHARVKRVLDDRASMAAGEVPVDWGFAESLAYASLVTEGYDVRVTGQDSGRGTFFHRHAVLHHQTEKHVHIPLQHVAPDQREFTVIDSLLSEEAVLGFEYGYATTEPDCLVIWEAQFGDFLNGAQVVIDQFICSGESKWGRMCGLVMFLPHGYEGQGPEHSSARLERFLQGCAEHNIQVCVPSTPAQMFHLLRRQMLQRLRKPLVVLTPKSLLRHRESVSALTELADGRYQTVIPEVDDIDSEGVSRLVFCSGKVYYDLLQARRDTDRRDVAIVRLEQMYPFPVEAYAEQIARHVSAREIIWCQEEPQNQGAWYQIRHRLHEPLRPRHDLFYAGREASAAPASGYYHLHVHQQQELVKAALGDPGRQSAEKPAAETSTSIRKKA